MRCKFSPLLSLDSRPSPRHLPHARHSFRLPLSPPLSVFGSLPPPPTHASAHMQRSGALPGPSRSVSREGGGGDPSPAPSDPAQIRPLADSGRWQRPPRGWNVMTCSAQDAKASSNGGFMQCRPHQETVLEAPGGRAAAASQGVGKYGSRRRERRGGEGGEGERERSGGFAGSQPGRTLGVGVGTYAWPGSG